MSTLGQFKDSLQATQPPAGLSVYAKALWFDGKGSWQAAHELIQNLSDANAAWVHAYLHRKEGDFFNADYWYKRAGKPTPSFSIQQEWEELVTAFLAL